MVNRLEYAANAASRDNAGAATALISKETATVSNTGKRTTAQRGLLLKLLRQAEGHLDAHELYQRARDKQPRISLSTVYRSLRLFKELGLVEEHQFDSARRHYEARSGAGHHHLVCLSCGRVLEFRCPLTDKLKSKITREEGFRVIEAEVCLVGYCPACQESLMAAKSSKEKASK